jgi:hypothetical protein
MERPAANIRQYRTVSDLTFGRGTLAVQSCFVCHFKSHPHPSWLFDSDILTIRAVDQLRS